jgi:molecular chaperone GrpE
LERQENVDKDNEQLTVNSEQLEETESPVGDSVPDVPEQEGKFVPEEKYLRLAAEYDNFRKRTAKERENLVAESRSFDLERAAAQTCTDEAYAQGIIMIVRQWIEALEKLGIAVIETQDMPFDPNLHNAVMHGEDESYKT